MKTLNRFALLLLMLPLMFGCSNSDDNIDIQQLPISVRDNFNKLFPGAKSVAWQTQSQYYIAEFAYNTFDTEAWFTGGGQWAMTETEYDNQITFLPMIVQNAFYRSQYSNWIIDDVTLYEKPIDSFCIIEVENGSYPDTALVYDMFGNLLNKLQGDWFDITPNTNPTMITF